MRIVSGSAKGKKILIPIDKKTRPLKDMVKESIYNIILHSNLLQLKIEKSNILDLFSGVGSFGLEAISRGAKKVVFFEDYKPAVDLLKKNIKNLTFFNKAEIYQKDISNKHSLKDLSEKFDLVFLDPPFDYKELNNLFDNLAYSKIIHSKTLIIIHRHRKSCDKFEKNFKVVRQEKYGNSKIIFGYFIF